MNACKYATLVIIISLFTLIRTNARNIETTAATLGSHVGDQETAALNSSNHKENMQIHAFATVKTLCTLYADTAQQVAGVE